MWQKLKIVLGFVMCANDKTNLKACFSLFFAGESQKMLSIIYRLIWQQSINSWKTKPKKKVSVLTFSEATCNKLKNLLPTQNRNHRNIIPDRYFKLIQQKNSFIMLPYKNSNTFHRIFVFFKWYFKWKKENKMFIFNELLQSQKIKKKNSC